MRSEETTEKCIDFYCCLEVPDLRELFYFVLFYYVLSSVCSAWSSTPSYPFSSSAFSLLFRSLSLLSYILPLFTLLHSHSKRRHLSRSRRGYRSPSLPFMSTLSLTLIIRRIVSSIEVNELIH